MDITFGGRPPMDGSSLPSVPGPHGQALRHVRVERSVVDRRGAFALTEACADALVDPA